MISICFILLLLISILTQSYGQVTCASGWVQYGGNCYLIQPVFNNGGREGTWDQCNAYCTTASSYPGATMLCVRNAAENDWIRSQYGGASFTIGYTDMLPYGGGKGTKLYKWVTGCSSTYTNWAYGEPNNMYNSEDWTSVYAPSGLWYDFSGPSAQCGCRYNPALTTAPSSRPTTAPSSSVPSSRPTAAPSSSAPSSRPTVAPSSSATADPSSRPTADPSSGPTVAPSSRPTDAPSSDPSTAPSSDPTYSPSATPSFRPSVGAVSE